MTARSVASVGRAYLTREDLCERWDISRATSYRLEHDGYLTKPVRFGRGIARWPLAEIEARAARGRGSRGAVVIALAGRVPTHPWARRARPWLPAITAEGRVYVGPTGEILIARADGGVDRVVQGGIPHGGAAEDESAGRRA